MTVAEPTSETKRASSATPSTYALSTWIFLRLLAVVHAIAFASFWTQLDSLVGPRGLLPATRYFDAVRQHFGGTVFGELPTLCWFFGTEGFLHVLCGAGLALALLLFAGVAPAVCLFLLWAAYLSLNCAGQIFFNFQWDALLLETTLLAVFIAPWKWLPLWQRHEPPPLARWLVWWLLFRLMFFAGVVKLTSGDPLWRNLTALTVHYETQPLPTPLGWYAHQAPAWLHQASCVGMFVVELLVPFLLFTTRRLRHAAALLLAALMIGVALTGNYTFFNLLAVALCLTCLDDGWWHWAGRRLPQRLQHLFHLISDKGTEALPSPHAPPRWQRRVLAPLVVLMLLYTGLQSLSVLFPKLGTPPGFATVQRFVSPYRSFNNYGLFAVMTNPRPELVFEGSVDGREWLAYEFKHKPGALDRAPTWVAPHQPRLDWQLWFAALAPPEHNRWTLGLCEHLLRGTPEILSLLAVNPFPQQPPRHIRVVRYEYHFTDSATRAQTGQYWRRTPLDFYIPPASLR